MSKGAHSLISPVQEDRQGQGQGQGQGQEDGQGQALLVGC